MRKVFQVSMFKVATAHFFVKAIGRIILGLSVGKILVIPSFRFETSKIKKGIDHWGYGWKGPYLFTSWYKYTKFFVFIYYSGT